MLKHLIHSTFVVTTMFAAPLALAQADSHAAPAGHEAQTGSGIKLGALTPLQVHNLALAGKVWGFLKYHHPAVTGGGRQWDRELLGILPDILAAGNRADADALLQRWIVKLGPVADCSPCATLDRHDFQLLPNLAWLDDTRLLSPALRKALKQVYRNRSAGQQFYVSLAEGVENPVFDKEPDYKELHFPDAGFQLLSLFRLWNIIAYWAPYRDRIDEDWDKVLRESIAPVALAQDRAGHELAMLALVARIHDTHTNLWSSIQVRPPVGRCQLPVRVRFIEGRATVSAHLGDGAAATGLEVGDLGNPGGFKWGQVIALYPQAARYTGKVMILVDDISQSQSEYTAMALRAGPRARVVGSTTAGADGDASWIPLPGGLRTMISGIGIFYPDKRPTQRIGIVPDIEIRPTIAGIRAGRDEVLDAAMAEILRD